MSNIGQKIRDLRECKNLSQFDFADKVGVSRQTISKWELGKIIPSTKNLMAICECCELPPNYFLADDIVKESSITTDVIVNKKGSVINDLKNRIISMSIIIIISILILVLILLIFSLVCNLLYASGDAVVTVNMISADGIISVILILSIAVIVGILIFLLRKIIKRINKR